jgi:hypothetical protein
MSILIPKPKQFKGIWFRSTLEAEYAEYFEDHIGWNLNAWSYEPWKDIRIDYAQYYTPDFGIWVDDGRALPSVVEVKPTFEEAFSDIRLPKLSRVWHKGPADFIVVAGGPEVCDVFTYETGQLCDIDESTNILDVLAYRTYKGWR